MKYSMKNSTLNAKLVSVLAFAIVNSSIGIAETDQKGTPKPTCNRALTACQDYVDTLEKERDYLAEAIRIQNKRIVELQDEKPSYPWYYYAVMGAASAIIIQGVVK